jgi:hypothetical protein
MRVISLRRGSHRLPLPHLQQPGHGPKLQGISLGMDKLQRAEKQRRGALDEGLLRLGDDAPYLVWDAIRVDRPGARKIDMSSLCTDRGEGSETM